MMSKAFLLGICVVGGAILLRFVLPRTAWFRRMHVRWLAFKLAWGIHKFKQSVDSYHSPRSKLERARKAVENLRSGFCMYPVGKIHLTPYDIGVQIVAINNAMEADFSYEQIGTTREEVIGFRNGEAHKTSARLQVELYRMPEQLPRTHAITELAVDAHFALEEIGTSAEELASLAKEHSRRSWKDSVEQFRRYARGGSFSNEDSDKFERDIARVCSPEPEGHGFSLEDLGTSNEEYGELMRLARRREVEKWINFFKHEAERGETNHRITRKLIRESLEKAGLTLADFNLVEADLDEIERSAFIAKARKALKELRTPGEGWFYSQAPIANPSIRFRFYLPEMWKCIPGDPLVFVKTIEENLATAHATLADIGASETEIKMLTRDGHLVSAKFLIKGLERVSRTRRRTQFQRFTSMIGPRAMIMDDPNNPIDRTTLEDAYPVERDLQAIEYHLKGAGIGLEEVGSSTQKLQELRTAIEAR